MNVRANSVTFLLALTALLLPRGLSAQTNSWAGSFSCRQCHPKFYELWSTSFHGLAMQPYTAELARTNLTPQKAEIPAGKYRFLTDLAKGAVRVRTADGEKWYPIVQAMGGKNVFYFLTSLERGSPYCGAG